MTKETKKNTKSLLIISSGLIAIGIALTAFASLLGGFPGVKITKDGISSTVNDTRHILPKTQLEDITGMDIVLDSTADFADIVLKPSEDEHFYLEYNLNGNLDEPEYKIDGRTLVFQQKPLFSVVMLSFHFFMPGQKSELILYVPQNASFTDISIRHSGTLSISGLSLTAGNMLFANTDNQISVSKLAAEALTLEMNDKTIRSDNLKADALSVSSSYRNCNFTNLFCESADIVLHDSSLTLDVKSLGKLNCEANYGDVLLTLPDAADAYDYDVSVEYGTLTLPSGKLPINRPDSERSLCQTASGKENTITIHAKDGDVTIKEKTK